MPKKGSQALVFRYNSRFRKKAPTEFCRGAHIDYAQLLCERGEIGSGMLWLAHSLQVAPVDATDLRQAVCANLAAWRPHLRSLRAVLRHQSEVSVVVFSPDDSVIVTGTSAGTVRLWDATTGKPIGEPMQHADSVHFVAFGPDGSRLLIGSRKGTVRLWDTRTYQPVGETIQHAAIMLDATFSPDGTRILTGSSRAIRQWDAETGAPCGESLEINASEASCGEFSPDTAVFVTGGEDGIPRVWDTATGKLIREMEASFPRFPLRSHLAFNSEGSRLVGGNGALGIWDVETGKLISQSIRKPGSGMLVAFSPDGESLLTGGDSDGAAWLWDVTSGVALGESVRHRASVRAVAFNSDGSQILTGGRDRTVRLWDVPTWGPIGNPMLHKRQIRDMAISPDSLRILTGCDGGTAQLWDATTSKPVGEPLRYDVGVWGVAFSPDSSLLMTEGRLWNAVTREPIAELERFVRSVAFSPDGSRIVTGGRRARLWNTATRKPIGDPLPHGAVVSSVAFSPDGATVLTGSFDYTARLWDAQTGEPIGEPIACQSMVKTVAFSPDGTRIVTGLADGTVRQWDAATRKPIGAPLRHQLGLRSVAFSPDGLFILTGSLDGTARLWHAATGAPVGPPIEPGTPVYAVAFSPDGLRILVGDTDGVAQLWQAPPPPVEGDVERLVCWIQVITGRELESNGVETVLDGPAWHQRRRRLQQLGGPPSGLETVRLKPSDAAQHQALIRHWREAGRCAQQGEWSEAIEHLGFLINAEPSRSMHFLDRGRAHAKLGQWDDAISDVAKATRLGADDRWITKFTSHFFNLDTISEPSEKAEKPYVKIVAFWEKLTSEFPHRQGFQLELARAYLGLVDELNRTARHQEADRNGRTAIALVDSWIEQYETRNVTREELIAIRTELDVLVRRLETSVGKD